MRESLRNLVELQLANEEVMRASTFMEFDSARKLAAFIFTARGVRADEARVKECAQILKKNAGMFSNWRGNLRPVVLAKMALADDPQAYFDGANAIYQKLVEGKFFTSEYQSMTATSLYEMCEPAEVDGVIERIAQQYQLAKEKHRFLTSDEDLPFIAMMVLAGQDAELMNNRAEECFELLDQRLRFYPETKQMISHVLALSEKPAEQKVESFWQLYQDLHAAKHDMDKSYMIAILAAFVDLDVPNAELVSQIGELDEFLKSKKGYGALGVGKRFRRLMAAILLLQDLTGDEGSGRAGAMGEAVAQVVVEQIVETIIVLCVVSSISASSASH